ncbi:hypothetical protein LLH00_08765 [bacterium]|nr:hypothetical protein [bacterium]
MKKIFRGLSAAALALAAAAAPLAAQYTFFKPKGSFAVEVSLENAGGGRLRLPIYRNAITSLIAQGDYAIGGTSAKEGLSPFLFAVSLRSRNLESVLDLSQVLPGQRAIVSGFCRGAAGALYAGTLADAPDGSGHLLKITFTGGKFKVQDLGAPAPGEGVFSLTIDLAKGRLYGISFPSGKFFIYEIPTTRARVLEETQLSRRDQAYYHHEYSLETEDVLSRALAVDRKGRVYGSRPVNRLFRYDPATDKFDDLGELPEVWGRKALGRVDAWAVAPDGVLFGGNAGDGQLFKVDPATGKVVNLGKPVMMPRIKGLAFAADGKLYGVAGSAPGYAHLFSYDPKSGNFEDMGNPDFPLIVPEIAGELAWRGYQFATVAVTEDGSRVLLGEEESQSQLMVFPVK